MQHVLRYQVNFPSTNHLIFSGVVGIADVVIIGSFSINHGNGNNQRHKLWIWLVERVKISVLHVCSIKTATPTISRDLDLESPKWISNVENLKIRLFFGLWDAPLVTRKNCGGCHPFGQLGYTLQSLPVAFVLWLCQCFLQFFIHFSFSALPLCFILFLWFSQYFAHDGILL